MKLTLEKKFGCVQIKPTRLVRVIHPHEVSLAGRPRTEKGFPPQFAPGQDSTRVDVGDLAIELVYVDTGKRLGWMHASGEAINVVNYQDRPDRYEDAGEVAFIDLGEIDSEQDVIRACITLRYAPQALALFELVMSGYNTDGTPLSKAAQNATLRNVMETVSRMLSLSNDKRAPPTAEVMGVLKVGSMWGTVGFNPPHKLSPPPWQFLVRCAHALPRTVIPIDPTLPQTINVIPENAEVAR